MISTPRIKASELFLESRLTKHRQIIVEGSSDRRFITAWAKGLGINEIIVVTAVGDIDVDSKDLFELGLNDGNRARVIALAKNSHAASIDIKCIADRDCGHNVEDHSYPTLLWTDYPALESYVVEEDVLDQANLLNFGGQLSNGATLLSELSFALGELYAIRTHHEHLPGPKYKAGLKNGRKLSSFDVTAAVQPDVASLCANYPRPGSARAPKTYAYGHDVSELLMAAYGSTLRNKAGLATREALEGVLMSALQVVGLYKSERLFISLEKWIATGRAEQQARN